MNSAMKEAVRMGEIHVYLENGFDHDLVTISAGGQEHTESDVSTRYQVGLAALIELPVVELDAAGTAVVRIALPERGLAAETRVDPAATPYVRVNMTNGQLDVHLDAAQPRLA
jgi:hypothetical protein